MTVMTSSPLAGWLPMARRSARAALVAGALGVCGATGCVRHPDPQAPAPAAGSTTLHTLQLDGRTRSYWLHLPAASRPGERLPLVLLFHGHLGSAREIRRVSHLDDAADRERFIVAYPEGAGRLVSSGPTWNAGTCCGYATSHAVDDVAFALAVVRQVIREQQADSTRVFAAGFSVGGMLALRLACEQSATFAGVADVEGAMPDVPCAPARPLSVLLIQGDADEALRADEVELRSSDPRPYAASLESAANFWKTVDACGAGWSLLSSGALTGLSNDACARGTAVALYTVHGNAHAWPGGSRSWMFGAHPAPSVDASALLLHFFASYATPRPLAPLEVIAVPRGEVWARVSSDPPPSPRRR